MPSARRLSQTLGHASSLMRFMPHASSQKQVCRSLRCSRYRAKHWLPQALRAPSVFLGCSRGRLRLSVLRRPAHGRASSSQRKHVALSRASHILNRSARLPVGFIGVRRGDLASSLSINPQVQFKRRSCSLRLRRWYASPSKYKARLQLTERGLTLPSSGPAYGGPLKSNVSRHASSSRST